MFLVYWADLRETCDNVSSVCRDVNAVCQQDGDGHGINRCLCGNGSKLVGNNGELICGEATLPTDWFNSAHAHTCTLMCI